ncbi:hypothetical protein [Vibrio palustris]|uniref:Uncharacterized protein n=1 Tax=Vibrio palustris TaxID=1918946 RepID=A0A1R4B4M8_9VIBR|nr:hypothetical protein [Vibrio palustris]SJL83859.1 hypothetical protein VPAL9027_01838 [Vibrio palustris]
MKQRLKICLSTTTSLLALAVSAYLYLFLSQEWALKLFVLLGSALIIHRYCCLVMSKLVPGETLESQEK